MMRVCVIAHLPPRRAGGALYAHKLYNEIGRRAKVFIIANRDATSSTNYKINSVWESDHISFSSLLRIVREIIRLRADIYHLQYEYSIFGSPPFTCIILLLLLLVISLIKKPRVVTLHGVLPRRLSYLLPLAIFYKFISTLSDRLIVHTELMKEVLRSYGISPNKITVIPHGVDRPRKSGDNPGRRYGDGLKKVLFFGFIRQSKGLEYLLDVAQKLASRRPDVRVVIAGGIPFQGDRYGYAKKLRRLVSRHKNVRMILKFIEDDEVDRLVDDSYILVLPYVDSFVETSGVVARVMAHGKPIVCTRIPRFFGELTHKVDCFMVEPRNSEALYRAVEELLSNDELRRRIAENLKRKAANRFWDKTAEAHLKLYRRIAG